MTTNKWFRHVHSNGNYYDFLAVDMQAALIYAEWKFIGGVIGELEN